MHPSAARTSDPSSQVVLVLVALVSARMLQAPVMYFQACGMFGDPVVMSSLCPYAEVVVTSPVRHSTCIEYQVNQDQQFSFDDIA